jgi:hypothetical protein
MDDFIYLLALIAWAVFAYYRRSQKKAEEARRAAGRPTNRDTRPVPTLEDILMGEDPETEPEPEPAPIPAPRRAYREPVMPDLRETEFEREYNMRGITSIEELDKDLRTKPEKEKISVDPTPVQEVWTFDPAQIRNNLRQAVIYSEILRRPYD